MRSNAELDAAAVLPAKTVGCHQQQPNNRLSLIAKPSRICFFSVCSLASKPMLFSIKPNSVIFGHPAGPR